MGWRSWPHIVQAEDHLAHRHGETIDVASMRVNPAQDIGCGVNQIPLPWLRSGHPLLAEYFSETPAIIAVRHQGAKLNAIRQRNTIADEGACRMNHIDCGHHDSSQNWPDNSDRPFAREITSCWPQRWFSAHFIRDACLQSSDFTEPAISRREQQASDGAPQSDLRRPADLV